MKVTTLEWRNSYNNKTLLKLQDGGTSAEVPPYNLDRQELAELIEAIKECVALLDHRALTATGNGGAK